MSKMVESPATTINGQTVCNEKIKGYFEKLSGCNGTTMKQLKQAGKLEHVLSMMASESHNDYVMSKVLNEI